MFANAVGMSKPPWDRSPKNKFSKIVRRKFDKKNSLFRYFFSKFWNLFSCALAYENHHDSIYFIELSATYRAIFLVISARSSSTLRLPLWLYLRRKLFSDITLWAERCSVVTKFFKWAAVRLDVIRRWSWW